VQSKSAILEGQQELSQILQKDFPTGTLFQRIIDAVNSVAHNLGGSAIGKVPPPDPVDAITIKGVYSAAQNTLVCPGELLHIVSTHNSSIRKGIQYIHEISTNPNFSGSPHPIDAGSSRSVFSTLPTFMDDGITKQTYYHRVIPQYPGSDPQKATVYGGLAGPTKIQMSGTTAATLLTSTGSGTASTGQGAQGLGTVLVRPAPTTKRFIA
jgi:hypothetical protein